MEFIIYSLSSESSWHFHLDRYSGVLCFKATANVLSFRPSLLQALCMNEILSPASCDLSQVPQQQESRGQSSLAQRGCCTHGCSRPLLDVGSLTQRGQKLGWLGPCCPLCPGPGETAIEWWAAGQACFPRLGGSLPISAPTCTSLDFMCVLVSALIFGVDFQCPQFLKSLFLLLQIHFSFSKEFYSFICLVLKKAFISVLQKWDHTMTRSSAKKRKTPII